MILNIIGYQEFKFSATMYRWELKLYKY